MSEKKISVAIEDDGVASILLNDPETRNAMTPDMGDEMVSAVETLNADATVRVVLITGAGRAFSAGGDLAMLARDAGMRDDDGPRLGQHGAEFYAKFLSVRTLRIPTIAVINGHAIGAGLCFSLGCDMRIAARGAKMGMTFTRLGIHPGMGSTYLLPQLIGSALASELLFTGRIVDADEALGMGLVNRVVQREDLAAAARQLAGDIASAGPLAVRLTKSAIAANRNGTLEDALALESRQQRETFATADAREGIRAIMDKRDPEFSGR